MTAIDLWDMYQIYADRLLQLFDQLRDLEIEINKPRSQQPSDEEQREISRRAAQLLGIMKGTCEQLDLSSARRQIRHIIDNFIDKTVPGDVMSQMLEELRRRIREDLEDHVYLCVPEKIASRFFKPREDGRYIFKVPAELMEASIVARFPSISDDIEAAAKCFISDCYAASVFHLMRIVEVGVLKVAKLSGNTDPKPSWGSVLSSVEKLVLRTKFQDLDPAIQPHRALLEQLLPQMQAIQRAWRNKFSHVEDKIIPIDSAISEPVAIEIMVAVEAFMRQLAHDLPPGV